MLFASTTTDVCVDYIRLDNRDLVERSVYWFGQYVFDLVLVNSHQHIIYTGLHHQYTGRDCPEIRESRLPARSDVKFLGHIPGLLAELSEQDRETSQMAAGDMRGSTATSAWQSGS